jgi:hypothetical protein
LIILKTTGVQTISNELLSNLLQLRSVDELRPLREIINKGNVIVEGWIQKPFFDL